MHWKIKSCQKCKITTNFIYELPTYLTCMATTQIFIRLSYVLNDIEKR